jgi:xylulokinase
MTLLLGIDIGTTGCKAIVVNDRGAVVADATAEYPLSTPRPAWSEQNPHDWWVGTIDAVRRVLNDRGINASTIVAVGLAGQMHGLVLVDDAGKPLRPCILWNDQRTTAQCEWIQRQVGRDRMIEVTGKPALPNFTAPKLLWVREHEPDVFQRAATMLLPKDYVRFRVTGERAIDVADASGTSLLDVRARSWSSEIVQALSIPQKLLPRVFESAEVCGRVSKEAADATGLCEGTPVVAGAGDQAAEAIGVGMIDEGEISVAIGTSGVVFVSFNSPRIDPTGRLHGYCHAAPGTWHLMGVMLSAGGSLRWHRDALCESERIEAARRGLDPYDVMIEHAQRVPAGCEGLLFLPYLSGERTPYADANARGVFSGLSLRHTRAHMTRAVLEGVTFGLLDSINLVRELGLDVHDVRASGGGSRSAFWRQMMADAFNANVITVNSSHGAAFGASILAGIGAGVYSSAQDAARTIVRETSRTSPGPDSKTYPRYYDRFRALYEALRGEFSAMAACISK